MMHRSDDLNKHIIESEIKISSRSTDQIINYKLHFKLYVKFETL